MILGKPDRHGGNYEILGSEDGNPFSHWSNATKDDIEPFAAKVQGRIKDLIGFRIDVNLIAPLTIPRSEGKAKRVMDER